MQCYTPTETSDSDVKDGFYKVRLPKGRMGDLNAKMGSNNTLLEHVKGKRSRGQW